MTQLDTRQERPIEITQISEEVPVTVLHELGSMFSREFKPAPLAEEITGPIAIERPGLRVRERIHAAITPNRPGAPFSADEVEPESRGHRRLSNGIPYKPTPIEEQRIAVEGLPARNAARRGALAVRHTGHHY